MAPSIQQLESPLEALERFRKAPADMPVDEIRALLNWLAEDPARLDVGPHCDPNVAAGQVKRLADRLAPTHV